MLQYICDGRLEVVIGAGYVPYEFQMFGKRREDRKALYVNAFDVLRRAWSGETFEYEGRSVTVRPVPDPPPRLLLGGTHKAVARRAARIADGFYPPAGENWRTYREACLELGKPDPGERFKALGPIYTHVTEDPDGDWARIAPHAKHVVESYAKWTTEAYGKAAGPFAGGVDPDDLRRSGAYQCLHPEGGDRADRGPGARPDLHPDTAARRTRSGALLGGAAALRRTGLAPRAIDARLIGT